MEIQKINGFLVINKPIGISSNRALSMLKRVIGKQKVGHLGTLDPLADGVLPVAIGEATKAITYITNNDKTYQITIKWGEQTSSDDTESEVIKTSDNRPALADLQEAINKYIGDIKQTPPDFSACKINGQRAYDLARQGKEVQIKAKDVKIYSIDIIDSSEDTATLEVKCGGGTYMRSLARDLGEDLECYGHCTAIKRTASGDFNIKNAIDIEDLDKIEDKIIPITSVIKLPRIELTVTEMDKIKNGLIIQHEQNFDEIALATFQGKPIAFVTKINDDSIRAVKVFNL